MAARFLNPDDEFANLKNRKEERDKILHKEEIQKRHALRKTRKELEEQCLAKALQNTEDYNKEKQLIQSLKRDALQQSGFYREPEPKIIFAIRIKGINKLAPKPKKTLQLLRLRQLHNGVFIKVNKATMEMLKIVTPFITYGYPSLRRIRNLIYKRGYVKQGKPGAYSRIRLTDNLIVKESLGKYGINTAEDLIREIYTCGPHFKEANNFLWPFKLSCPKKGWVAKRRGFTDPRGGDWGNRETHLNELLDRMV